MDGVHKAGRPPCRGTGPSRCPATRATSRQLQTQHRPPATRLYLQPPGILRACYRHLIGQLVGQHRPHTHDDLSMPGNGRYVRVQLRAHTMRMR